MFQTTPLLVTERDGVTVDSGSPGRRLTVATCDSFENILNPLGPRGHGAAAACGVQDAGSYALQRET